MKIVPRLSNAPLSFTLVALLIYVVSTLYGVNCHAAEGSDSHLVWSTYLGGRYSDYGSAVGVDAVGNVYVAGSTESDDFPTPNGYERSNCTEDSFLSKFAANGDLVWSTCLACGWGWDVAVDMSGNVYVAGAAGTLASAEGFPILNAYDPTHNGGADAYVAKFDADGELVWSTFLGGTGNDGSGSIELSDDGRVYVAGGTFSADFPITLPGPEPSYPMADTFVAAFTTDGQFLWSRRFPTHSGTWMPGLYVAPHTDGYFYVAGQTESDDFEATPGAFDTERDGADGFVAKLSSAGTIQWATFLGGNGGDSCSDVATDQAGNVYVTGPTGSDDFPIENSGCYSILDGGWDQFITSFDPGGSLRWSTLVRVEDAVTRRSSVVTDTSGNLYVAGMTDRPDFAMPGSHDPSYSAGRDASLMVFSGEGVLLYSTCLGGATFDLGKDVAVDSAGKVSVVGHTASADFPVYGGYDMSYNEDADAFVTVLDLAGQLDGPQPVFVYIRGPRMVALDQEVTLVGNVEGGEVVTDCHWTKDGGAIGDPGDMELDLGAVAYDDDGVYVFECTVDDEAVPSEDFRLMVVEEVPLAGGLGLGLIAGACALAGALSIRRKRSFGFRL